MIAFRCRYFSTFAAVSLFTLLASSAGAGPVLDTVDWVNPNPTADQIAGTGSGTLDGGAIGVAYQTITGGIGNAATTITEFWDTSLATIAVAGGGVTNNTGGVLGTIPSLSPLTQTISFTANISNVTLLVNFTDTPTQFNFAGNTITGFSGNDALLTGSVVSFPNPPEDGSSDDGFAISFGGTYGPSNSLTFTYSTARTDTSNDFDSVGFTLTDTEVPEIDAASAASALTLLGFGVVMLRARRSRAA